ncbi:MAG: hypothetical protein ACRDTD_30875, partial [Pseudonocardiaceae bacterium]
PWAYLMLIGIHVVLLLADSTRWVAVDGVRAAALTGRGRTAAAGLLRIWGAALLLVGVLAVVVSARHDVMTSPGRLVGVEKLEVSLGTYNLLGAAMLIVLAALMLAAAVFGRPVPAYMVDSLKVCPCGGGRRRVSRSMCDERTRNPPDRTLCPHR